MNWRTANNRKRKAERPFLIARGWWIAFTAELREAGWSVIAPASPSGTPRTPPGISP